MGGLDGLDGVGLPLSDCVTAFLSMSIWAVGLGCWPSIVAGLGLGHVVAFDGRRSAVGGWWSAFLANRLALLALLRH